MKICYCEDERAQAEYLRMRILSWAAKTNTACRVDVFGSAEEFLFQAEEFAYDLILLDIAMNGMNGMDLAKKIRRADGNVKIVFLTSDPGFVFEGYEVDAFRYLLKPVTDEKLYEILELASREMETRKPDSVILRADGEKRRIFIKDISFVEVQGHYVRIHTDSAGEIVIKESLSQIIGKLNEVAPCFVMTHRCFAVNIACVSHIGKTECVLTGGEKIPVSRNSYKTVNEAFIGYHKSKL